MTDNQLEQSTQKTQESQDNFNESNLRDSTKKSIIDLKKIQEENPNQLQVQQNPNAAQGQPSIQVLETQEKGEIGQSDMGESQNCKQEDDQQKIQQNTLNINFTSSQQISPRKGERGSSLSPKRRIEGNNTPGRSPFDPKYQKSKLDLSQTNFFITNINAFRGLESFPKINQLYNQINSIIEDLEGRVDTVVERHEAEFLFAYRNHMAKIKQEMTDMKKQAEEQEKRLNDNDRVAGLERQIVWLRDECLGLYKILGKKKDDLAGKERVIKNLQRDNIHLSTQIKELMRKNKLMSMKLPSSGQKTTYDHTQKSSIVDQMINLQSPLQSPKSGHQQSILSQIDNSQIMNNISQNQSINQDLEDYQYLTTNINQTQQNQLIQTQISPPNLSSKRTSINPQNYNTQNQSGQQIRQHQFSLDQFLNQQQIIALEEVNPEFSPKIISLLKKNNEGNLNIAGFIKDIAQFCKQMNERQLKQYKLVKDKLEKTLKVKLKMGMARSDLETFFLECVETARKQIIKRKYVPGSSQNSSSSNQNSSSSRQNNTHSGLNYTSSAINQTSLGLNQTFSGQNYPSTVQNAAQSVTNQTLFGGGSMLNPPVGQANTTFKNATPTKNMNELIDSLRDYRVFRNEDKIKILELLLSHEKLMIFLYQKIFPTNFNMHLQNAIDGQEEIPFYLRTCPQNQQADAKFININDSTQNCQNKNNENYLDLLTEEDTNINNYQEYLQSNGNTKGLEQTTKLPSIAEQNQQKNINNLYSVNYRKKRNSIDQKNILETSQNNIEQSSVASKYQVQVSRLGPINNKYSQRRNSSLRNSKANCYGLEVNSDSKNKQSNLNYSFEDSKQQLTHSINNNLYQATSQNQKKTNNRADYSAQKPNNQNQSFSHQTPSPLNNISSQDNNRVLPDKINLVNGKLVFKNN